MKAALAAAKEKAKEQDELNIQALVAAKRRRDPKRKW
jgi:hypothetical protein